MWHLVHAPLLIGRLIGRGCSNAPSHAWLLLRLVQRCAEGAVAHTHPCDQLSVITRCRYTCHHTYQQLLLRPIHPTRTCSGPARQCARGPC
jgi:hypothetical protein